MDKLVIFDTTLRDGEQAPGASMNLDEKMKVAIALEDLGVDVIEAGFPVASEGDFKSVKMIADTIKNSTICGLARAKEMDIDACAKSLKGAKHSRIHTFIATSALHMETKLRMKPEEVLEAVKKSVSYAKKYADEVEWSAEDAGRSEIDFLCRAVETAIKAGATTINLPDTVGYLYPDEYANMFKQVISKVPNSDKVVFSCHCHDDLGMAVANSLAGMRAGARQIECAVNGIGERAGNASLEEVVMAIKVRGDHTKVQTRIKTEKISKMSQLVSTVTGYIIPPNKAIVGANAFAHESGIHQAGVLRNPKTYEIMTPDMVGKTANDIVLGKHSGSNAFRKKLEELLPEKLSDEVIESAFKRFKDLADKKKEIYDDDILALVGDRFRSNDRLKLNSLLIVAGSKQRPQIAALEMEIDGENKAITATGEGPVDAAFNGVKELFPHDAELLLYQVNAVTKGTDAQAGVLVRLSHENNIFNGHGADSDTLVASVKAYINALNKMLYHDSKKHKDLH